MKTSAIIEPHHEVSANSFSSDLEEVKSASVKQSEFKIEVLKELIGDNMEALKLLKSLEKDIHNMKREEKLAQLDELVQHRNKDLKTLIDPVLLINELDDRTGIQINVFAIDKEYEIFSDQEMLLDGLKLFLKSHPRFSEVAASFSYAGSRGVLKFEFKQSILQRKKELSLLNAIMQSNDGFMMEESDALHLVFAVKGKYSHLSIS